jgi:YgiT-type zinc finger domain-containing protein
MKCVICHSSDIEEKTVNETFWVNQDVVLAPCRALVCNNCGERYYSRQTMRHLEEIEERLRTKTLVLETVGQVLKLTAQSEPAGAVHESTSDYRPEVPKK